jgi:hypothetical protein
MIKNILFIVVVFTGIAASAQTYPEVILPNSTKTIESKNDTLWILKESQLQKAIIAAKKLAIEEEISKELRNKISLMETKDKTKDSLIIDIKKDRDYYVNNWKTCTADIDILLKQNRRQKWLARLGYIGIAISFVAGFFIGK